MLLKFQVKFVFIVTVTVTATVTVVDHTSCCQIMVKSSSFILS